MFIKVPLYWLRLWFACDVWRYINPCWLIDWLIDIGYHGRKFGGKGAVSWPRRPSVSWYPDACHVIVGGSVEGARADGPTSAGPAHQPAGASETGRRRTGAGIRQQVAVAEARRRRECAFRWRRVAVDVIRCRRSASASHRRQSIPFP